MLFYLGVRLNPPNAHMQRKTSRHSLGIQPFPAFFWVPKASEINSK